jgi:hypothetical protein
MLQTPAENRRETEELVLGSRPWSGPWVGVMGGDGLHFKPQFLSVKVRIDRFEQS